MPAMTQTAIVAQAYDADVEYTTWIAGISTLISLIFIPLHRVFRIYIKEEYFQAKLHKHGKGELYTIYGMKK